MMNTITKTILASCLIIVLLHVWGAIQPSHWNWGIHLFAFYNILIALAAFLIGMLLLIPKNQKWAVATFDSLVQIFSKRPFWFSLTVAACALIALALLLPARLHLLGDGALL